MSYQQNCWTKEEVTEAFAYFQNPAAKKNEEEAAGKLAKILEIFGQEIADRDIYSISENFVPSHCVSRMAGAVIRKLAENKKRTDQ